MSQFANAMTQSGTPDRERPKSVLLALSDTHHGFYVGSARYAREHGWHLVTDMIYTASIPHGWRGDGILSYVKPTRPLQVRAIPLTT